MIELKKTKDNDYRFLVKSDTGKTLLKSVAFNSQEDLNETLNNFKAQNDMNRKLFERKTNTEGKFLIELKNQKGQTIGRSGLYSSEAGMENGILNISNCLIEIKN